MLNLLNIDYSPEAGTLLCIGVLSTLTALLAGNEASRKQLQLNPGYDSVLRAVLERTAPKGPSDKVLLQVLHLILEVCHSALCADASEMFKMHAVMQMLASRHFCQLHHRLALMHAILYSL